MKKQFVIDNEILEVDLVEEGASFVLFNLEGEDYSINLGGLQNGKMSLNLKGKNHLAISSDPFYVVEGEEFVIEAPKKSRAKIKSHDLGQMKSPMPGKILKILVKEGDSIQVGTPLLVMEAMKMEHTIKASKAGIIDKIFYLEGEQIAGGVELVKLC